MGNRTHYIGATGYLKAAEPHHFKVNHPIGPNPPVFVRAAQSRRQYMALPRVKTRPLAAPPVFPVGKKTYDGRLLVYLRHSPP
ncbi:hypothetical protein [Neisseria shayeganii]|uniref:hypothetical protein n=1 Tax=Neisseria shayeganii TaxID=607712 RepID=UPI0012E9E9D2|nr:hypothetical protein [Neisseria shayeganii]